MKSFLRLIISITLSLLIVTSFTEPVISSEITDRPEEISKVELKIAKNYSKKFCNAIGIGMSQESSLILAIKENENPSYNSSLWGELLKSGKKNIDSINQDRLTEAISENIISECGRAIGMRGESGVNDFIDYFNSVQKNYSS